MKEQIILIHDAIDAVLTRKDPNWVGAINVPIDEIENYKDGENHDIYIMYKLGEILLELKGLAGENIRPVVGVGIQNLPY